MKLLKQDNYGTLIEELWIAICGASPDVFQMAVTPNRNAKDDFFCIFELPDNYLL